MSKAILISACLLGENCRYDGGNSVRSELLDLLSDRQLIPVCPEVEGGLPIPRPAAEIRHGQVFRENGEEVTAQFQQGAQLCLESGQAQNAQMAILKSRSPACGCGKIYDGSFTGTLVEGDGIFTRTLKTAGIDCISDENYIDNNKHP